jgi:hypothetical protein
MRTVAFSEAETVKALSEKFVCAWVNRRPDLKFKDGLYPPGWKPRGLSNGSAVTNVTSVFATPDGTIMHAIPGYLDGASFRRHLDFALALARQLSAADAARRAGLHAETHKAAAKATRGYIERQAHEMLAPKLMRVGEMKFEFFDGLGNVFV